MLPDIPLAEEGGLGLEFPDANMAGQFRRFHDGDVQALPDEFADFLEIHDSDYIKFRLGESKGPLWEWSEEMDRYVASNDGVKIHYETAGAGKTALVFVHGWLGNCRWWDAQRDYFSDRYIVVQMDLGGHGKSGDRAHPSAERYAEDIRAVAEAVGCERMILVGHSMSGAYMLEASRSLPKVRALVAVDTLKNLDQVLTAQQAEEFMFQHYRKDYRDAVENMLPKFLFSSATPRDVRERLTKEFLSVEADRAIRLLAPLYEMDVRALAKQVTVPVRAINSDFSPTNAEVNRKYFRDYDFVSVANAGHYPMLERPAEFNGLLEQVLEGVVKT